MDLENPKKISNFFFGMTHIPVRLTYRSDSHTGQNLLKYLSAWPPTLLLSMFLNNYWKSKLISNFKARQEKSIKVGKKKSCTDSHFP